jgi:hypothetical protein
MIRKIFTAALCLVSCSPSPVGEAARVGEHTENANEHELDSHDLDIGEAVSLVFNDGKEVEGELVAIYDHSVWWDDPTDTYTFGLFRSSLLKPYPDDESMIFVSSLDVASTTIRGPAGSRYRDAMRDASIFPLHLHQPCMIN